jgi:hypothetical protein
VRDACIEGVDDKVRRIAVMTPEQSEEMYELANEVFAEGGAHGLDEVAEAARNLCDLLMSSDSHKNAAIKVHIDALQALRHRDIHGDVAKRQAVLRGLRDVVKRYAPPVGAQVVKDRK